MHSITEYAQVRLTDQDAYLSFSIKLENGILIFFGPFVDFTGALTVIIVTLCE